MFVAEITSRITAGFINFSIHITHEDKCGRELQAKHKQRSGVFSFNSVGRQVQISLVLGTDLGAQHS